MSPRSSAPPPAERLQRALALHRGGRLDEAAALYRQVLERAPDSADALHLLGALHLDRGEPAEALPRLERAVELAGHVAAFQNTLGRALAALGRHRGALEAYVRAAALRPGSAEILGNLARTCRALGARAEALEAYRRALAAQPDAVETRLEAADLCGEMGAWGEAMAHARAAHARQPERAAPLLARVLCGAGVERERAGAGDEAEALYREVADLHPGVAEPHFLAGNLLRDRGDAEGARRAYERALEAAPGHFETLTHLGVVLGRLGLWDEAWRVFRAAVEVAPERADAHYNLALACQGCGDSDAAERGYRAAVRLDPRSPAAHNNLGNLLKERALQGGSPDDALLDEAEAAYRASLAVAPDDPEVHHNLSLLLLLRGSLREGLEAYEWRDRTEGFTRVDFVQPVWEGEALPGSTLFVHAEQGMGDTLQFCRYLRFARERCGRVVLACHRPLVALLARAFPSVEVVPAPGPVPLFDRRIALMSLARVAGTELATIPAGVPYLFANPYLREVWRARMEGADGLRVGIAWRGNPEHRRDAVRSLPGAALLPLLATPGVTFFSLQKGAAHGDDAALVAAGLVDRAAELRDFDDTAALVANLDLVIACDTSVLHLAGALGAETWALLPAHPDWRWLLERDDSPWYPTMRLFRQRRSGDWPGVVDAVRGELEARQRRR